MEVRRTQSKFGHSNYSWTTEAEIDFLAKLGSWVPDGSQRVSRKVLLQQYLIAMYHRVEWGSMDPHFIRVTVQNMIAKEK